jgi:ketosteroid isomerase-like protein
VDERHERAREVISRFGMGPHWEAAMDPDMDTQLAGHARSLLDAYRRVDLEALFEHLDPEIEIVQPPEIPDATSYRGREGFIEAFLDWPGHWKDFSIEPCRIFGADAEHLVVDAIHRGRSESVDLEVEAQIVFLMRWVDGLMTNWDMFLTVEEALGRAAERRAHRHDDHAAQGDRRE